MSVNSVSVKFYCTCAVDKIISFMISIRIKKINKILKVTDAVISDQVLNCRKHYEMKSLIEKQEI